MSDKVSFDTFFEQGEKLLNELGLSEAQPHSSRPRTRTRGGFIPGLDESLRLLIELAQTPGPHVGFLRWLVQLASTRRLEQPRKHLEFLTALVAGMLAERGLQDADEQIILHDATKLLQLL